MYSYKRAREGENQGFNKERPIYKGIVGITTVRGVTYSAISRRAIYGLARH